MSSFSCNRGQWFEHITKVLLGKMFRSTIFFVPAWNNKLTDIMNYCYDYYISLNGMVDRIAVTIIYSLSVVTMFKILISYQGRLSTL